MTHATPATADDRKFVADYRDIRADYAFDPDIMNDEPEKVRRSKQILASLPVADRVIFTMYTDCASLRKLADRLGVSYVTLQKEITRIRKDILAKYDPEILNK